MKAQVADAISAQLIYENFFTPHIHHIYKSDGQKETIDSLLKIEDIIPTLSNEWGRLANGNKHNVKATNTIEFIERTQVPQGKKVTYATLFWIIDHLKMNLFESASLWVLTS